MLGNTSTLVSVPLAPSIPASHAPKAQRLHVRSVQWRSAHGVEPSADAAHKLFVLPIARHCGHYSLMDPQTR